MGMNYLRQNYSKCLRRFVGPTIHSPNRGPWRMGTILSRHGRRSAHELLHAARKVDRGTENNSIPEDFAYFGSIAKPH